MGEETYPFYGDYMGGKKAVLYLETKAHHIGHAVVDYY